MLNNLIVEEERSNFEKYFPEKENFIIWDRRGGTTGLIYHFMKII